VFGVKRLPEPGPSQKMSGWFLPKVLATTELSRGAVPPSPRATTTPPEKKAGAAQPFPDNSRARHRMVSSISGVSTPVKVFC
jgi:hypothetical protein